MDDPSGKGEQNIIAHDFGHEKRHKSRRLRRLLDLDALHEVNVRKNPLPYLERASERIFRLEQALFEANLAAGGAEQHETPAEAEGQDPVTISRAEHDRLLACREIVHEAFETLVKPQPDD